MNQDQLTEQVIKHSGEIAALQEKAASAHKRIDENDRITDGIHKLAANVESLAMQVKLLTEKMESSINRLDAGLTKQGERIGTVEKIVSNLSRIETAVGSNANKIEALEKEPATKWKDLVKQVIALAVAALFGIVAAKFM